ncbi:uncharacterized protein F4807DRAFT_406564 [Annulohypoxylon truncatum]|uniref:uncharacterized protein n=1 Tax=Annulohypoxylon truncatum TaxID=327061 RepID=UPI0020088019|nr:uncharacterized protein F4807DRAFT_406564 [Annulohypoxylon truncatum]KAI1214083.1 hypothetical protein F4807DRAFT_406564 [Annulohypoxylon truncatum]
MSKIDDNTGYDNSNAITRNIHNDYKLDLTDLPNDVFFLICSYLSPQDCVRCRRVSRLWFRVFASEDTSRSFMRWYFPRCREMRQFAEEPEPEREADEKPNWSRIFANVARRYFCLRSAKPRSVGKIMLLRSPDNWLPVDPWFRRLYCDHKIVVFDYFEPSWTVDRGLLVYLDPIPERFIAFDLETRNGVSVPFDTEGKYLRRVRLACDVLIIEWCEDRPCKEQTSDEDFYRHFTTAFDVVRRPYSSTWDITFRSEWQFHPACITITYYHRFFSVHTSTHYALYLWTSEDSEQNLLSPREELIIWDISKPSPYRVSLDPSGVNKPVPGSSEQGPVVINKFSHGDLNFLGLLQRNRPRLLEILLDEANVYFHEEDHPWLVGAESNPSPPRHHQVRCTGFPFSGIGPRWFDECCADGDVSMSFCPRAGSLSRALGNRPPGFSDSKSGTWPGWAPCWRHEEFPYLTVSHVVDAAAGVRIVARQCFMMKVLSSFVPPKISVQEERNGGSGIEDQLVEVRFEDAMWHRLLRSGKIMGDERWVVGDESDRSITIVRF